MGLIARFEETGKVPLVGNWVADGRWRKGSGPKHRAAAHPEKSRSSEDKDFFLPVALTLLVSST